MPPIASTATLRGQPAESGRNFLSFRDGLANLGSADGMLVDKLVWVRSSSGEPDSALGGSYRDAAHHP